MAMAFSSVAGSPRRFSDCLTSDSFIIPLRLSPRLLKARSIVDSRSFMTLSKSSHPIVREKNVGFAFSMNALAYHSGRFRLRMATWRGENGTRVRNVNNWHSEDAKVPRRRETRRAGVSAP